MANSILMKPRQVILVLRVREDQTARKRVVGRHTQLEMESRREFEVRSYCWSFIELSFPLKDTAAFLSTFEPHLHTAQPRGVWPYLQLGFYVWTSATESKLRPVFCLVKNLRTYSGWDVGETELSFLTACDGELAFECVTRITDNVKQRGRFCTTSLHGRNRGGHTVPIGV